MAILDVRGTHGSGKSWVMHSLLKMSKHHPLVDERGTHLGYRLCRWDAALLGHYGRACGGCDGIKSADEVVRRLRKFQGEHRHVLLEGILVAHTFSRYNALAKELPDYRFFVLDTPLATCKERVDSRRAARGQPPLEDYGNVEKDWYRIWVRLRQQLLDDGRSVTVLNYLDPLPPVLAALEDGQ